MATVSAASSPTGTGGEPGGQLTRYERRKNDASPGDNAAFSHSPGRDMLIVIE
jgi:hypothetical protein